MGSVVFFFQQGSLLVALLRLSATRYVRVPPPLPLALLLSRACTRKPSPDFDFLFVDTQRRYVYAFLVGVGEVVVQCHLGQYCCVSTRIALFTTLIRHTRRPCVSRRLPSALSFPLPPIPVIPSMTSERRCRDILHFCCISSRQGPRSISDPRWCPVWVPSMCRFFAPSAQRRSV
jgi:hypothetical protein